VRLDLHHPSVEARPALSSADSARSSVSNGDSTAGRRPILETLRPLAFPKHRARLAADQRPAVPTIRRQRTDLARRAAVNAASYRRASRWGLSLVRITVLSQPGRRLCRAATSGKLSHSLSTPRLPLKHQERRSPRVRMPDQVVRTYRHVHSGCGAELTVTPQITNANTVIMAAFRSITASRTSLARIQRNPRSHQRSHYAGCSA